ncbi:Upf1 family helicase [Chitinophaga sedimenti]|uniref:C-terminal helicase domain-containing protein n=1 Tax=Chitinophaga sedimenti TaxID=2033606 RepID=UPI002002DEE5|nr:C-terminal helicase domain-containing protein [Chitinophaga sedimenti]MCK7556369.1 Upf1 family helicase [Chitinophaga sedimenti]
MGEENGRIKDENIYTMVGLQSFDSGIQANIPKYGSLSGDKIRNLTTQYRSIEAIGTIFSRFLYGDTLEHGRKNNIGGAPVARALPAYFSQMGFRPVTIVKYPVNREDAIYSPHKLNESPFHLYSALLINELIFRFRREAVAPWNVGILSPYKAQANLINKLLEAHSDKSKLDILTDTVHGFQGGEREIVFALFNPSSLRASYSRFFQKEFIINVAVSRARDYLVLLLPDLDEEMAKLPLFHSAEFPGLMNIIDSLPADMVAHIDARDLEAKLMGSKTYFQENSFTNVHQNINVYGDSYKDYIIRHSSSSLDLQIKKI